MKRNITWLTGTIFFISMLISCKKDDPVSSPVIRKWNIARHIDTTQFFNGPAVYLDYQPANHSDYLDFRSDGKLYRSENGTMDTSTFTLTHDTLIVNHHYAPYLTTFKIEVSTADSLQLNGVSYVISNSHDYEFTHYYLNKW